MFKRFFPNMGDLFESDKHYHRNDQTYSIAHNAMFGSSGNFQMPIMPEGMTEQESERFEKVMGFISRTATSIIAFECFEFSAKNYHALRERVLDNLYKVKPNPAPSFFEVMALVAGPSSINEYAPKDFELALDAFVITGLIIDSVRSSDGLIKDSTLLNTCYGNIPFFYKSLANAGSNTLDSLYNPDSKLELRTFENA